MEQQRERQPNPHHNGRLGGVDRGLAFPLTDYAADGTAIFPPGQDPHVDHRPEPLRRVHSMSCRCSECMAPPPRAVAPAAPVDSSWRFAVGLAALVVIGLALWWAAGVIL